MRYAILAVFAFALVMPAQAGAVTLVTCPEAPSGVKYFAIDSDSLSGGSVSCYDYGDTNNITGELASDDFWSSNPDLDHIDYDGSAGDETDNGYYFTNLGDTDDYVFGTFTFGTSLTSANTTLYLGLKTGNKHTPVWAVFELTGFLGTEPLTGTWYIYPKQGSGVSHSSIYGNDVPNEEDECEEEPCEPPPPPDTPVPEPTSMFLLGTGLVGVAAGARKRFRKQ